MNNPKLLEKFIRSGAFSLEANELHSLREGLQLAGDDTMELIDVLNENRADIDEIRSQLKKVAPNFRPLQEMTPAEISALAFSGNCPPATEGSEYADLSQNELAKFIFK